MLRVGMGGNLSLHLCIMGKEMAKKIWQSQCLSQQLIGTL